ncbi:sigma-70 family RNA polymerase sigma factor [Niabella drilacis]|uniref:RNA polymerase sigma-70 factor, ECF subfamily n=1 Tax=Niabella drilacis (strain DSM 25811 / CCM 8410 / CCUG 62505 / LMG 26954 / E90) TaxID=1285928 RepID=A0A1G6ZVS3_NIADE|nr:sigma-70 family RNA polymerase sigma factor [Niabella drilacis]SDE05945.1 RNA polymerase sigma-70 factor, ECF subfamily [Niabella drilacis]
MTSFELLKETELIQRILEGETALYEILIRRYNPGLYKTGRSYNYNHEDTQDLMQDTFVDAYKSLEQFEGRSDFKTWLIRIMMNHCYRKRRKAAFKNEIAKDINDNSAPMFTGFDNDTGKMVQNNELGRVIEDALGRLPFDYRIVFSLREMNGLNVSETAGLLEITEANVKVRLNRAKTMLRNEIEKMYAPSEIFEFNLIYCDAIVHRVMEKIKLL